jgi:ribosomal protein S17E
LNRKKYNTLIIAKTEKSGKSIKKFVRNTVSGFVTERVKRRMQKLSDHTVESATDFRLLLFCQIRQLVE